MFKANRYLPMKIGMLDEVTLAGNSVADVSGGFSYHETSQISKNL